MEHLRHIMLVSGFLMLILSVWSPRTCDTHPHKWEIHCPVFIRDTCYAAVRMEDSYVS